MWLDDNLTHINDNMITTKDAGGYPTSVLRACTIEIGVWHAYEPDTPLNWKLT